jgi:hypothetical protein
LIELKTIENPPIKEYLLDLYYSQPPIFGPLFLGLGFAEQLSTPLSEPGFDEPGFDPPIPVDL